MSKKLVETSKPPKGIKGNEPSKLKKTHPVVKLYRDAYTQGWYAQYIQYKLEEERETPAERRIRLVAEKDGLLAEIKRLEADLKTAKGKPRQSKQADVRETLKDTNQKLEELNRDLLLEIQDLGKQIVNMQSDIKCLEDARKKKK